MYDPRSPLLRDATAAIGLPQPEAKARFAEDRLLDAVVWCELLPGETVTEADMMERFGLTRAAARAALTRLGYDGWASPQPRLGWQILPVTGALMGQVLNARRMVEPAALAATTLTDKQRGEVAQIGQVLSAVHNQQAGGALVAFRHFVDKVDSHLIGAVDPFTARHLRKLWHHSARMVRYLEDIAAGRMFRRDDVFDLVRAVVEGDADALVASRHALIDAQERFLLQQMLKSEAALSPGSGLGAPNSQAVIHGRST